MHFALKLSSYAIFHNSRDLLPWRIREYMMTKAMRLPNREKGVEDKENQNQPMLFPTQVYYYNQILSFHLINQSIDTLRVYDLQNKIKNDQTISEISNTISTYLWSNYRVSINLHFEIPIIANRAKSYSSFLKKHCEENHKFYLNRSACSDLWITKQPKRWTIHDSELYPVNVKYGL